MVNGLVARLLVINNNPTTLSTLEEDRHLLPLLPRRHNGSVLWEFYTGELLEDMDD